ncbi:glycosyltransferase [Halomonas korlensis]|uniref:Glycosyltransferase involved in cell wall bisynthesis n=1 Tax=Halomonas korlensis TaxID=463301 RepID=A0A1I7F8H5_9GAMM|nr:glycosyltransferase [Halomonas korlensis]SFU32396.1 Glycosyltransferase involved in cell wall bisynthesis [Halomonas korlensis]
MNIAMLLPDLRGGGVERVRLVLAKEFSQQGHRVEFVLLQARGELLAEAEAHFVVHDLACERIRYLPLALARYLKYRRPDALLAAMWPMTVLAPLAARLSGHTCSVLVSEHNTLSEQYKSWGRMHRGILRLSMAGGYRLAKACVAVSEGVSYDLATLSGVKKKCFSVINNPIPQRPMPSQKNLSEAESLWGVPSGGRILSVGSLKAQKNHDLLLRSFAQIKNSGARLMLVGDGSEEGRLRLLSRELGIVNQVIFAGFHRDPTCFYLTADLFVLSSCYEGFGNVIVEALLNGTPVVSTNCPFGPAEILRNGEYGILVPVNDEAALTAAMKVSLASDHDSQRLMTRAKSFSPAEAAKNYLELLIRK